MPQPNLADPEDLAIEQISVDRARSYLTNRSHSLDEATVSLMLQYLDTRQNHIDRIKARQSR